MNGPTVDCGKTPVEFTVLCIRLSAVALEKKKERPGPLPVIHLSCRYIHESVYELYLLHFLMEGCCLLNC